ncbi:MAG: adenosine deaminase [Lachnospiraceae bacterium]
MVELHLHLDGSLSEQTIRKIVDEEQLDIPELHTKTDLHSLLHYQSDNGSLADYLKCFDLPIKVLQTPNSIRYAVMKLSEELILDGISFAEIRFAPQFHTTKGFSQEEILIGALEARDYASLLGVEIHFILCAMRGQNNTANEETLELAIKYLGKGVVALDLAGDEASFPTSEYAELFKYAKKKGLPFTMHAGEAAGPESIEETLRLGALRIGHGVAAAKDNELMNYLAKHKIPLELCPTSNLQTKAVEDINHFPLVTFLEKGIPVTLNTDNRTVSSTCLKNEFRLIEKLPGYKGEYKELLKVNAGKARFKSLI